MKLIKKIFYCLFDGVIYRWENYQGANVPVKFPPYGDRITSRVHVGYYGKK